MSPRSSQNPRCHIMDRLIHGSHQPKLMPQHKHVATHILFEDNHKVKILGAILVVMLLWPSMDESYTAPTCISDFAILVLEANTRLSCSFHDSIYIHKMLRKNMP